MKVVFYGLTITSAWGNGHATTYRALIKALASLGHSVLFIEKDVAWYRENRDLEKPDFCRVRLYQDWLLEERSLTEESSDADAIIIGSYFPDAILATHALLTAAHGPLLFYDIDTPITMAKLRRNGSCEYLNTALISHYSTYLSLTGGPMLLELEHCFHSPKAVAFYCSADPAIYYPVPSQQRYRCDLSYLGTYAPDRQAKLLDLLNRSAALLPESSFLVAGAQYPEETLWEANVGRKEHVAPLEHPAFYSSSRFTLNLTRSDMVAAGYSPSVRLFEASACGTAILSDTWKGIEQFFTPGEEILLPGDSYEVASSLRDTSDATRLRIGKRARERVLAEHTSIHRAHQFEEIVSRCTSPHS